ncbi:alkaline phosphatase PhoX [Oceanicaulis sp. MMSF_3324]|uniref:alkaline phosphatase PhoX n=1 Tax=Oceanicaulis sp. MMSF_3324 TaxID=3046702 RepID=UPI00273D9057|nr:alkaline phosphatase PhoX [Oceanicaulis sp. MMSF_3324]
MTLSRRSFLSNAAAISAAFSALPLLSARAQARNAGYINQVEGYGPLEADPDALFDLPAGFDYVTLSETGAPMDDGLIVPGDHDGMACFPGLEDGQVILVRNHEMSPDETEASAFGPDAERLSAIDAGKLYDHADGGVTHLGGTTTIHVDLATRRVVRQFLSLGGTERNCAGGPTPWGSWITCEESLTQAGPGYGAHDHGYAFEVPSQATELVRAEPLTAMGRFNREACATDPRTSIVYQTEDDRPSLFTRFIPNAPGELRAGGRLQALKVIGQPGLNTHNWDAHAQTVGVGETLAVEWIDVVDAHNPNNDLASRMVDAGAANFTRGEGMWFGDNEVFFCCTDGGPEHIGQIWRYRPSPLEGQDGETAQPGELTLLVQTTDERVLEKCDNITVAPWGDLVVVEDGDNEQFIRGVTPDGRVYTIGRNAASDDEGEYSEITGPCFSPDGSTLFFNVQNGPGRTFAVKGPWETRSLTDV